MRRFGIRVGVTIALLLSAESVFAATFIVLNNLPSGNGSLKWAIDQANNTLGLDAIYFDPSVVGLIAPVTRFKITEDVDIVYQPGQIQIDLSSLPPGEILFDIGDDVTAPPLVLPVNVTMRGLWLIGQGPFSHSRGILIRGGGLSREP